MTTVPDQKKQYASTDADPYSATVLMSHRSNLTRLQNLYWIAQTLRPSDPFLSTTVTFTIPGAVDFERLQRAFHALLTESDALRTVIHEVDGMPRSSICPLSDLEDWRLQYIDLSEKPDPRTSYRHWIKSQAASPLDLRERLFDSALVKLNDTEFVWYLKQHHIIADASSFLLLFRRIAALYESFAEEAQLKPASLPLFEEYIAHERAYADSPRRQRAATYWQKALPTNSEPMQFFGQKVTKTTTEVERVSYDLEPQRSEHLRQLAKQKGIFIGNEHLSLYNVFATLFFVQLYRLTGSRQLSLLTPVHNRSAPTFKEIVGLLMELCPLQAEISETDTFISLLSKVKRTTREAMMHYQYGAELALNGNATEVMFNMYEVPELSLGRIPVHFERVHSGHGTENIVLNVVDYGQKKGFSLHFDFHKEVFDQTRREQTVESFLWLIDAFLADNTQPIEEANYLMLPTYPGATNSDTKPTRAPTGRSRDRAEWYQSLFGRRDPLELQLTQIWEDVLSIRPIDVEDNFFELGGTSLLAVHLFRKIEELTGDNLSLSTLLNAATIRDQARLLREGGFSAAWSSLVPLQPKGSRPPFFCVHGGGGNVVHYRVLAHHLGEDQPFYGLQPRGMDGKQPFHTSVEDMAAYYIREIQKVQPAGPYFLGGYCFGATVAFEIAHQLRNQGQQIGLLVSLDGATYDYPELLGSPSERIRRHLTMLIRLRPKGALAYVKGRLQRRGARIWKRTKVRFNKFRTMHNLNSAASDNRTHPPHHWEMVRTIRRAYRKYDPQVFPGRLTLFRALGKHDDTLGWSRLFSDGVDTCELMANRSMDIFKEPHVQVLAKELSTRLSEAQGAVLEGDL